MLQKIEMNYRFSVAIDMPQCDSTFRNNLLLKLAVKEEKLDALKQELLRPEYQSSYSKLTEIQGEIDALEEEIMADMENWEELSQQLEELEG